MAPDEGAPGAPDEGAPIAPDEAPPTSLGRPGRAKPKPYQRSPRADQKPAGGSTSGRPPEPSSRDGDKPIGRRAVLAILGRRRARHRLRRTGAERRSHPS